MPTHNDDPGHGIWDQPEEREPEEIDTSLGYEGSDVRVTGIVVFLVALGVFVAATAGLCYGIGMAFNSQLNKEDGPNTKWAKTADVRQLGNLPSNPAMQNKVEQLTEAFPTPRLQTDDGNQEIADLHGREDLLLNHYTWVDDAHTKVRIPIEQAMEQLVASNSLKVAPEVVAAPLLTGDSKPVVKAPLTDGFARTGYEQDQAQAEKIEKSRE